jgi:hypothetical protein
MRVLAAQHPPTTVEVHHDRQRTFDTRWAIDANGDLSCRTDRKHPIFDIGRQFRYGSRLRIFEDVAGVRIGQLIDRSTSLRRQGIDERLPWEKLLGGEKSMFCLDEADGASVTPDGQGVGGCPLT